MENKKMFDYENVKKKFQDGVTVVKDKVSDGIQWGLDNPDKVIVAVGVTVSVLKVIKSFEVSYRANMERRRIDHTYYDPSTGFHWDLCRKASNNDRAEILRRKKNGEDVYDILRSLRLIK